MFFGISSRKVSHYGMVQESDGPDALLNFFRQEGVPVSIVRDISKVQTSEAWSEYMKRYWVKDKFIEPYHSAQNPCERMMSFSRKN